MTAVEMAFRNINQNPNLPLGISVGNHTNNESIFCLSDDNSSLENRHPSILSLVPRTTCYKDTPGVHRALSNFILNDYKQPEPNKLDEKKEEDALSLQDIDNLVPGMWLNCLYDINDAIHYEAMFLTADAEQMRPDVVAKQQNPQEGLIGVEYGTDDWEEEDKEEEVQKWVPISWCKPYGYITHSTDTDSQCDYMIGAGDSTEALFHRAFKELTAMKKQKQSESESSNLGEKILFTYTQQYGEKVVEDEDGYLKMGSDEPPFLPVEMDTSSYTTIYSALPFSHPAVNQVDDKVKLYQLYKDDPVASNVFPKSYLSYREALLDTEPGDEDDSIFYIKDAGGTRGQDIYIKTWDELALDYEQLKKEGEYDVNGGEGDIIIQLAVTDLYTIDGDGPIAGRRFDIRYYLVITDGSVYLHSSMVYRWTLGPKYDPKDTNVKNQVINVVAYAGGEIFRDFFLDAPLKDANGNAWPNNERKRRTNVDPNSPGSDNYRGADAHGWRDAVADALDDACGVFSTLKEITKADPTKYVLVGGDAMIKEDGSAVIVEFNIWPDLAESYSSLTKCLAGEGCRRMVMLSDDDSDINVDNYVVTEPSPASAIASTEGLAEVMRDIVSMVTKIQPAHGIEGFREIVVRNNEGLAARLQ